jgi:tRNA-splicing ligase RtcB
VQEAEDGSLWVLVHSGSRAVGPAILAHHARRATRGPTGFATVLADSDAGREYLGDVEWALAYAEASRRAMLDAVALVLDGSLGARPDDASRFSCVHNLVRAETHGGEALWVHRKGAAPAAGGIAGIVPGSMGTSTFHVEGRGEPRSLGSSSHGAGRVLARGRARRRIEPKDLRRQMGSVVYDRRRERDLVEEAPSAYRDVGAVMRAQRDLVRVVRRLRPLLCYKGA